MGDSIYPSIPVAGQDLSTIIPAVEAIRQTLNLIILNGMSPNPDYTPSQRAQIFVTYAELPNTNVVGPPGPIGPAGPQGPQGPPGTGTGTVPEAPNDANSYARHQLTWQSISVANGMVTGANPAQSNSSTYVMQGLGLVLTPLIGTKMVVSVSGAVTNLFAGDQVALQMFYGLGPAPPNGNAQVGSGIGSMMHFTATNAGDKQLFSKTVIATGLSIGTPYWFDLGMQVSGGMGEITDVDIAGHGIV